ncbi:hypothetical protein [Brachybacterium sacelli]
MTLLDRDGDSPDAHDLTLARRFWFLEREEAEEAAKISALCAAAHGG